MAIPRNLANLANQLDTSGNPPKVQVGDSSVVVSDTGSNGTIAFTTDNSERMRVTSGGNVGIGTTSPSALLNVSVTGAANGSTTDALVLNNTNSSSNDNLVTGISWMRTGNSASYIFTRIGSIRTGTYDTDLAFSTNSGGTLYERARILSNGVFLVGKTVEDSTTAGCTLANTGTIIAVRSAEAPIVCNRLTDDGTLVSLRQASTEEGTISVSGTTVSYNGGHLSRWAQTTGPKDETLLKGTVLSNLDEMNVYTDVDGNPVDNEQLNKVKVSDVEGDVNVAGVFVNWSYDEQHLVDEINMAMTGDMIIRIAQGVVVQKGDLLMSAGDGTAKPQGDDIVRSKTVAKVTSNHVTCTYEDGSYCVPCVLMAC